MLYPARLDRRWKVLDLIKAVPEAAPQKLRACVTYAVV